MVASLPLSSSVGWRASFIGKNIYIGDNTRIEDSVIIRSALHYPDKEYVKIGSHCRICHGAQIHSWDGFVEIGDYCSVNANTILYGSGGLRIGNYVRIAAHTVIVASMHLFDQVDIPIKRQGVDAQGITIEDDVWIGAGVRILDGLQIRTGAIIGAGSVVTKNVDPYDIVAGVPARIIRNRRE
jgi:acetyltransferase-like isoleucine patch superfamily enzyme